MFVRLKALSTIVVVMLTVALSAACADKVTGVPYVNADSIAKVKADSTKLASAMAAKYVVVVTADGGTSEVLAIAGKHSSIIEHRGNPFYLQSPNIRTSAVITDLAYGEQFVVGAASEISLYGTSLSISAGYTLDSKIGGLNAESAVSFHNEGIYDFGVEGGVYYGDTAYISYSPTGNKFRDEFKLAAKSYNLGSRVAFGVGELLSCRDAGSGYVLLMKDGLNIEISFGENGKYSAAVAAPKLYKVECYRLDQPMPASIRAAMMAGKMLVRTD